MRIARGHRLAILDKDGGPRFLITVVLVQRHLSRRQGL
jgi:hypothetical protein